LSTALSLALLNRRANGWKGPTSSARRHAGRAAVSGGSVLRLSYRSRVLRQMPGRIVGRSDVDGSPASPTCRRANSTSAAPGSPTSAHQACWSPPPHPHVNARAEAWPRGAMSVATRRAAAETCPIPASKCVRLNRFQSGIRLRVRLRPYWRSFWPNRHPGGFDLGRHIGGWSACWSAPGTKSEADWILRRSLRKLLVNKRARRKTRCHCHPARIPCRLRRTGQAGQRACGFRLSM